MKPFPLLFSTLFISVLAACDGNESHPQSTQDAGRDAGETDPPVEEVSDPGSHVFDPTRVAQIELEIDEEGLAVLRDEADKGINSDDFTYVTAQLTFDGERLSDVGVRVKGNSSRRGIGGDESADVDAIPYKVDTNRFIAGQKLDGLTKLNLHQNDSLNEYLSYGAFRNAGIASSRTGWADVTLNGRSLGLYTLVEQVDERMLAKYYDDPEGELYKPEPPVGFLNYQGEDVSAYGDLGYKAEKDTDHQLFIDLVRTLDSEPVGAWDSVIDLSSVLWYFAGNVALGNWDTYQAMGHNYYLYEAEPDRLQMLPWDLNLSQAASGGACPSDVRMSAPGGGMRPEGGGFTGAPRDGGMLPEGFSPPEGFAPPDGAVPPDGAAPPGGGGGGRGAGPFGGSREAPLYDGIMNDPELFADYIDALQSFVDGPGSVETLNAAIDVVVPVLGDRVTAEAVEEMRAAIESRISEIRAKLPTTTSCETGSASEVP